MQLLKTEFAFYNSGKLYTVYDVYAMSKEKTLTFDIHDPVYASVWESIDSYLRSNNSFEVSAELKQFVAQNVVK